MTITISVSDLRNNMSSYLNKVAKGVNILVRDEKRGTDIARIIGSHSFNKSDYEKALLTNSGIISARHEEWKNKASIGRWLRATRQQRDRKIN